MYNRRIHTIMAKRYTKRAYKKRRTLRKLRVKHRNTQRGGDWLDDMKATGNAALAAGKAAAEEQTGKLKAANSKLMERFRDVKSEASGLMTDVQARVANGPPTATVLTKTSFGALNEFVALAKAMYSLMDMINIAKYYTSNPIFALEQLKKKTSEIRTNLLATFATYQDIDTCITALQTAIGSAPKPQTSPPELIPPESFNEKLTRLHNEISTEGVSKTIHRDISAINATMIEMSRKPKNKGLIECFNKMKDTVLPTEESKNLIISGITELKNANPKAFSAALKLVVGAKEIGAKMAQRIERTKAALGPGIERAKAALGAGIEPAQPAQSAQPAIDPAAMSSIKSGPSQAATAAMAALDEVKKAASEYAEKTKTIELKAKQSLETLTKQINTMRSEISQSVRWEMLGDTLIQFQRAITKYLTVASANATDATVLLAKANAAASASSDPQAMKNLVDAASAIVAATESQPTRSYDGLINQINSSMSATEQAMNMKGEALTPYKEFTKLKDKNNKDTAVAAKELLEKVNLASTAI
jgi:hypothetical protein